MNASGDQTESRGRVGPGIPNGTLDVRLSTGLACLFIREGLYMLVVCFCVRECKHARARRKPFWSDQEPQALQDLGQVPQPRSAQGSVTDIDE